MDELQNYCITIKGHLTDEWSDWFDGIEMTRCADGHTKLIGTELDQAALYAILLRIHQRGLVLVSLERLVQQTRD